MTSELANSLRLEGWQAAIEFCATHPKAEWWLVEEEGKIRYAPPKATREVPRIVQDTRLEGPSSGLAVWWSVRDGKIQGFVTAQDTSRHMLQRYYSNGAGVRIADLQTYVGSVIELDEERVALFNDLLEDPTEPS